MIYAILGPRRASGVAYNIEKLTNHPCNNAHQHSTRAGELQGYLELADLEADEYRPGSTGLWTRGLLIRRNIADGAYAFFTTWCPAGTSVAALVAVEGHRWSIEDSFECAKTEFGLDHNESRSWHGWHRHVSLAMLAFAMMATIRHHANAPALSETPRDMSRARQPSSDGRSRKSAASPRATRNAASDRLRSSRCRSGDGHIRPPLNVRI